MGFDGGDTTDLLFSDKKITRRVIRKFLEGGDDIHHGHELLLSMALLKYM